ncbi:hypothetical protein BU25DRAFT_414132 [Macroventuria anomochaeta]|uniref:Uncharacterized protein n=1 Tax=Macroventuria anomochaeta TaxID=301207 RepID=A0ACB6RPK3_9PLEO|nr:uncharacterized protein BU25DRAFT_414132 [Macroventuria anomochaeta]KAF2623668.1 hypothetical protein BU25DRAFT_414132 [Macroventuria anomochaeta]
MHFSRFVYLGAPLHAFVRSGQIVVALKLHMLQGQYVSWGAQPYIQSHQSPSVRRPCGVASDGARKDRRNEWCIDDTSILRD